MNKPNNRRSLEERMEDLREVYTRFLDNAKKNHVLWEDGYYTGALSALDRITEDLKFFPLKEVINEESD